MAERAEYLAVFRIQNGILPALPPSVYVKTPTWSAELYVLSCSMEEEIDHGDMGEVA